jgi:NitT/TauT family transport system substrate-binding protein
MRHRNIFAKAALFGVLTLASTSVSRAEEVSTVRFAKQFGIGYLPLTLMKEMKLVEKHAKASGLSELTVEWTQLSSGAPINDALIADQIDFAAGGVGPLVTIWAKTRDSLRVRGVAALNAMPLYLNTINPDVKDLKDFTEKDRIALPAVKVSIQAVTLQMAAEKLFGEGKHDELDKLTVSMSHPDGMTSMLSGRSEITAHFTSAPFMYQELNDTRVKRVLSSYDVLGGPSTFNVMWCKEQFVASNPKAFAAVTAALDEAMAFIRADPAKAAEIWAKAEAAKLDPGLIEKIVLDPENEWTVVPKNVMAYAEFMYKVGSIKTKPADWKELFFANLHQQPGS